MDQSNPVGDRGTGLAAEQTKGAVKNAATDVTETAKAQLRNVAGEVGEQTRNVAAELRDTVAEQARAQQTNIAQAVRAAADELDAMAGQRPDSTAATVVARVADGGHRMADYLDRHGPEGVLDEVREFARRRPGAFLATALVSGFVVGRLGRGVLGATGTPSPADNRERRFTTPSFADDTSPLGSMAAVDEDTLVYSSASDGVYVSGESR
jgi:hypothetical protein